MEFQRVIHLDKFCLSYKYSTQQKSLGWNKHSSLFDGFANYRQGTILYNFYGRKIAYRVCQRQSTPLLAFECVWKRFAQLGGPLVQGPEKIKPFYAKMLRSNVYLEGWSLPEWSNLPTSLAWKYQIKV